MEDIDNKNDDPEYKGSSDETKSVVKFFEDFSSCLQKKIIERVTNLENENLKLTEDLEKNIKENKVLKKVNLRLKKKVEQLKNKDGEIKDLKAHITELNIKLLTNSLQENDTLNLYKFQLLMESKI